MIVAICDRAGHAEEERPVGDPTRVVGEVIDDDSVDRERRAPRVNGTEEVREQHAPESSAGHRGRPPLCAQPVAAVSPTPRLTKTSACLS